MSNFDENKAMILTTLRREGPHRIIDLVRKLGEKRFAVVTAIDSLAAEKWLLHDGRDRFGVKTRRDRDHVLAVEALDAAVDDRDLHEILELEDVERAKIAALSRAVEAAQKAAWTEDGGTMLRDVDEPQAGKI